MQHSQVASLSLSLSHGAPVCYLISNEVAQKMIPRVFLSTCPNLLTLVKIADVPGATLQNLSISNVIKTGSSRRVPCTPQMKTCLGLFLVC